MSLDLGELVARARIDLAPVRGQLRDLDAIMEQASRSGGQRAGRAGGQALASGVQTGAQDSARAVDRSAQSWRTAATRGGRTAGVAAGRGIESGVTSRAGAIRGRITGILSGANSALSKVGIGVGLSVASVIGATLVKGFSRLNAIDQAKAKLTGLGNSAKDVQKIMDNALAAVRGTAFGMDEAATTAAGAVAAGVKPGKDLERTLKLTADAATIAGTSMGEMGSIFNKVATSNKIQGDVIAQLSDAGIPVVQMLAKELGKSAQETVKLASAGKINFAQFQDAMQKGLGGAAQQSGKTFSGALKNAMASLSRIGANTLEGVFPKLQGYLTDTTKKLATVEDQAKGAGAALGGGLGVAVSTLGTSVHILSEVLGPVVSAFNDLPGPVKQVVLVLAAAKLASRLFGDQLGRISSGARGMGANVRTWTGNVRAMGQLAREEAPHVGRFNAVVGAIGTGNGNLARMAQSFQQAAGQASRFPRAAGSAAAAMTGLRSAGRGLVGFLGGPWGLALAGAGVALMFWQKHQQDAAKAAAEHKQRVDELTDAIKKDGNEIGKASAEQIAKNIVDSDTLDLAKKMGISQDTLTKAWMGQPAAMKQVNNTLDDYKSKALQSRDAQGNLTSGAKEQIANIEKVRDGMNGQVKDTGDVIDKNKAYAESQKVASDALKEANAEQRRTDAAVKEYKAAQKEAQTAAEDTARANRQLKDDLDDANSAFFATRDATRAYEEALDDARATAKKQGKAGLSDDTAKGRENAEKLDTAAKDAYTKLQQLFNNHASNSTLTKTLKDSRKDLTLLAESFGLTKKQAEKYVKDALGKIPADIKTRIETDTTQAQKNLKTARAAAKSLGTTYEQLPKSVQTELKTLGEVKARRIARELHIDYDSLPPEKQTDLIADSSDAKAAVKDLGENYDDLPKDVQTKLKAIGGTTARTEIQKVQDAARSKEMKILAKTERFDKVMDQLGILDRASRDKTFTITAQFAADNAGYENLKRHLGGRLPGFASGTQNAPEGLARVAENGAELVLGPRLRWLPAGAKVLNHSQTMAVLGAAARVASPVVPVAGTGTATAPVVTNYTTRQTTHEQPINIHGDIVGADVPAIKDEISRQKFLAAAGTRKAGM